METIERKKILVVGGAGYIGGFMSDQLRGSGTVTVYDNLTYETRFLKDIDFIFGDVRDQYNLKKAIDTRNCDVIVWLAAIVGDGACAIDPYLTKSINTDAVQWLVDNCNPKTKIVFTSTCSVYGRNDDLLDEESPVNPLSVYAETKLKAERYIIENFENHLVFRLGTLFGLADEHSRIRLDLVVNLLSKRASLGEPITVYGGEQWRPLLHVKDVANAVEYGIDKDLTGLYNLSIGNYRMRDIAEEIKDVLPGVEVRYQDIEFEDRRNYKVKNNKYLQTGWDPWFGLEYGIKEIDRVVRENRIKWMDDSVYSNVEYLKKIWEK